MSRSLPNRIRGRGEALGSQSPPAGGGLVELSHVIRAGMVTYPGLPGSQITPYLIREALREHYAPGTGFWLTWAQTAGISFGEPPRGSSPAGFDFAPGARLSLVPAGRPARREEDAWSS